MTLPGCLGPLFCCRISCGPIKRLPDGNKRWRRMCRYFSALRRHLKDLWAFWAKSQGSQKEPEPSGSSSSPVWDVTGAEPPFLWLVGTLLSDLAFAPSPSWAIHFPLFTSVQSTVVIFLRIKLDVFVTSQHDSWTARLKPPTLFVREGAYVNSATTFCLELSPAHSVWSVKWRIPQHHLGSRVLLALAPF